LYAVVLFEDVTKWTDYSDLNLAGSFLKEISLIPGQALIVKVLRGPVSGPFVGDVR
jgi:hypothetical protein